MIDWVMDGWMGGWIMGDGGGCMVGGWWVDR